MGTWNCQSKNRRDDLPQALAAATIQHIPEFFQAAIKSTVNIAAEKSEGERCSPWPFPLLATVTIGFIWFTGVSRWLWPRSCANKLSAETHDA
jgi:hypothetical protein